MFELEEVRAHLHIIGLNQSAPVLDRWLDIGAKENLPDLTVLNRLL